MTTEKYVFISYSSKDRKIVNEILQILEGMGISYWKAPEMIPAGSNYAREIPRAIQACEIFLLFLSASSQQSIWVEKEVDSAVRHRRTLIPIQIDDAPLSEMFLFYLNNVQMISYSESPKDAIAELKSQLRQLVSCQKSGTGTEQISYFQRDDQRQTNASGKQRQSDDSKEIDRKSVEKLPAVWKETQVLSGKKVSEAENVLSEKSQKKLGNLNSKNRAKGRSGRLNALSMNRVPVECRYCGDKGLQQLALGLYRCKHCGGDNFDDFQTVRNYLEQHGPSSAVLIEKETGVPRNVIEYFFEQEYLEIPSLSDVRLSCRRCGGPIRTGSLCEDCKSGMKEQRDTVKGGRMQGEWFTKKW